MRFLMPHLQRAFRISRFVSDLQTEKKAFSEALEKLPQGVILVNVNALSIFINVAARDILDKKDGLSIDRHGRLQSLSPSETCVLTTLIQTSGRLDPPKDLQQGGIMHIMRPSGLRPLSLMVAPLSSDQSDLSAGKPVALVLITDPEMKMENTAQLVQRLYELTPAEARLMLILAQGKSVLEASDELGVRPNTARTHLKHIFRKTGARRQSDLVRLLVNSPAAFR